MIVNTSDQLYIGLRWILYYMPYPRKEENFCVSSLNCREIRIFISHTMPHYMLASNLAFQCIQCSKTHSVNRAYVYIFLLWTPFLWYYREQSSGFFQFQMEQNFLSFEEAWKGEC